MPSGCRFTATSDGLGRIPDPQRGDPQIRRSLEQGDRFEFERSALYERVFALAEKMQGRPLPRAVIPQIDLQSPKIKRKLTTEWFATRVEQRYRTCINQAFAR